MKSWFVFVLAMLLAHASFAVTYTTIDYPGAESTFPLGLNTNGDIVGYYQDASGVTHGFLYSSGVYSTLDAPSSTLTVANGINDSGQVLGYYFIGSTPAHGFSLQGQTYTTLDDPAAQLGTVPLGVNNAGIIVGYYSLQDDSAHGFELINGVWNSIDLAHAFKTFVSGINNNGDLFGWYYTFMGHGQVGKYGFLQTNGHIHILASPPIQRIQYAGMINDSQQGVGLVSNQSNDATAFIFQPPNTFVLLQNLSTAQPRYMAASGINDKGQVVGAYQDSQGVYHGFLAAQ